MDGAAADWYRRLVIAAIAVHAGAALLALHLAIRVIAFPYPVDFGEAFLLDQVARLSAGEALFRPDMSSPPYVLTNYPPVFITVQAPFLIVFGPAYWYGRLISYAGAVTAAIVVGLMVWRVSADRRAALLAGLALVSAPFIVTWSTYARVDGLALGLGCAGLYAVVASRRTASVVVGAMLVGAAVYTRQANLRMPSAGAVAWLLSAGRRRDAAWFVGTVTVVTLGVFALLQLSTDGAFFFNVVTANLHESSTARRTASFVALGVASPALVAAGVLCAFLLRGRARWLTLASVAAALAPAAAVAKSGSSFNYFFELLAACSLALGLVVAGATGVRRIAAVFVIVLLIARTGVGLSDGRFGSEPYERLTRKSGYEQLLALIRATEGVVVADEASGLVPLAGRRVYIESFEMKQLARAGRWDRARFISDIESRRFGLILLTRDLLAPDLIEERWDRDVLDAVRRAYRATGDVEISDRLIVTVYGR